MAAMIQNDEEKEWMIPLLSFRNEIAVKDDRLLRDFRRMSGAVQLFHDRPIPGPYKQETRENLLRKLLKAQKWVRENGPDSVKGIALISPAELHEIRRIWLLEKHEMEDNLPRIFEETTGQAFPSVVLEEDQPFGAEEMAILRDVCGERSLHFEMVRDLLWVERNHRTMARRSGLYQALEAAIKRCFFDGEEDATLRELGKSEFRKASAAVMTAEPEELLGVVESLVNGNGELPGGDADDI